MLDPGAQLCPTSATGTSEAQLFLATERGDLKEMRRILEDADPNVPVMTQHGPMTCLMEAAKSEHVAVLQLLLDSAAAMRDASAADANGLSTMTCFPARQLRRAKSVLKAVGTPM